MSRNNQGRKHGHYFKGVRHLTEVDVYRVCDLFRVDDPSGATQHAIKKLLLPGQRGGGKERAKDYREAVDTLLRRLEMLEEDAAALEAINLPPELLGEGDRNHQPLGDFPPTLYSEADEQRMDVVGSNGNGGEHYAAESPFEQDGVPPGQRGDWPQWEEAPSWAEFLGRTVSGGSLVWVGRDHYKYVNGDTLARPLNRIGNLARHNIAVLERRPKALSQ